MTASHTEESRDGTADDTAADLPARMRGVVKARREHGALEVHELDRPTPGRGEALIEVAYAGLCGSDLGIYEFEPAFERMDLPTVIGHEYAGRVVAVGPDVDRVSVGDRVVERVIRACGDCRQCRMGLPNVCQNASITGVDEAGAFAGYLVAPVDGLHHVPADLDLETAALTEPAAVGARAAHHATLDPGDRVLVEGPGPIGLLAAQFARAAGAEVTVTGVGRDAAHRLPTARAVGFDAVDVSDRAMADLIAEHAPDGFDAVIDATGHPSGLADAATAVRKAGTIVLAGQSGTVELDFTPLIRGEVDLQCSYAYTADTFERTLRALERGAIDTGFVDRTHTLEDPTAAFEAAREGAVTKALFDAEVLR